MSGLTQQGFVRERLDAVLATLKTRLQGVYGSDIVIDETSPDGQALAIFAEAASDLWQVAEDIYNAFDPNAATGQALFRLGAFCGITWKTGFFAQVALQVQVRAGETLPAGAIVEDAVTGVQYATAADVASTDSSVWRAVTGVATAYGTAKSLAGNVTKIPVARYELLAVRNLVDGNAGTNPETQAQFRVRRAKSVAGPSQGMTDGLRAELGKITAAGRVKVYENSSSETVSIQAGDNALPPHAIAVVVENDADPAVANAIWLRKSQGLTLAGSKTTHVVDSAGVSQVIRYTVASDSPTRLAVAITYREIPGQGFGAAEGEGAVRAALSQWVLDHVDIGALLNVFDLVPVIQGAVIGAGGGKAIDIETLQVGIYGGDMTSANVAIPWNSVALLNVTDISMTAV